MAHAFPVYLFYLLSLHFSIHSLPAGPPESMREHIVAASKVMKLGDWKACKNYILAVSCWELFPHSDQVKEMLAR